MPSFGSRAVQELRQCSVAAVGRLRGLQGLATDKTLTRTGDWAGTGVTTDTDVRAGARIMAASVLLYGSVQARCLHFPLTHVPLHGPPAPPTAARSPVPCPVPTIFLVHGCSGHYRHAYLQYSSYAFSGCRFRRPMALVQSGPLLLLLLLLLLRCEQSDDAPSPTRGRCRRCWGTSRTQLRPPSAASLASSPSPPTAYTRCDCPPPFAAACGALS